MFRRLVLENSAAWFTLTAFFTAASIYVAFTWRALRMKPGQLAHFERLPFDTATPACGQAEHPNTAVSSDSSDSFTS